MIPYGRQDITEADVQAVVDVLRSDYLTQGQCVPDFEQAIAGYCGANHGVAVNSATSALHLACLALDLGVGDWLWTSPITFVASANCARYCGAEVDFVDIDPRTFNLCPLALEKKLQLAEQQNRLPKIVIPVHLAGQSCDMQAIYRLAQHYGFHILEDASHAVGGKYQGQPIGDCRYSDITVFSFHPVKIITTAEGGLATTNNPYLAERMRLLRSHGITRDPDMMTQKSDGAWYYQQLELGFNYRMTELQAALGISQIQRLDAYVQRRQQLAAEYTRQLADLPLVTPWQHPDTQSAWHLYILCLKLGETGQDHQQIFDSLRAQGIGVNLHYIPVHTQPYYQQLGFKWGDFPNAEQYYRQAISLPLYPGLSDTQQQQVIEALSTALNG